MKIVKVYGPYSRKQDKRKIVVLRLIDGKLTTKSYARFLYEQENGLIDKDQDLTVDHIDENEQNDILENLQLLTRGENVKKSHRKTKFSEIICSICNKNFMIATGLIKYNQNKGIGGPFCSKRCVGVYSTNKQYNRKEFNLVCETILINK